LLKDEVYKMKALLTNEENTFGLVIPDEDEEIIEIGLFGATCLHEIIDFCKSLEKMGKNYDTESFRFGFMKTKKNEMKLLAIQPKNLKGDAWVVLAPRGSEDD